MSSSRPNVSNVRRGNSRRRFDRGILNPNNLLTDNRRHHINRLYPTRVPPASRVRTRTLPPNANLVHNVPNRNVSVINRNGPNQSGYSCLSTWAILIGIYHLLSGAFGLVESTRKLISYGNPIFFSSVHNNMSFTEVDNIIIRPYSFKITLCINGCALGVSLIMAVLKRSSESVSLWLVWLTTIKLYGIICMTEFEALSLSFLLWEVTQFIFEASLIWKIKHKLKTQDPRSNNNINDLPEQNVNMSEGLLPVSEV